jgi:hypothetical protein
MNSRVAVAVRIIFTVTALLLCLPLSSRADIYTGSPIDFSAAGV